MGGDFGDEPVDNLKAVFLVGPLPASEPQLDADFHVVAQKLDGMSELGLKIMRINIWAELKLFHAPAGRFVAFAGLGFFVKELAVVNDPADRRRRVRRDLDEIELPVPRQLQGGIKGHDAQLLLFLADHAYFAGANLAVSAMERFVTLELSKGLHSWLNNVSSHRHRSRHVGHRGRRRPGFVRLRSHRRRHRAVPRAAGQH